MAINYPQHIRRLLEPLLHGFDKVALFDFPAYDNVGDHAIWLGETYFLRQTLKKKIIASGHCGMEVLPDLPSDVPVLLQGGGNLGDLWPQHDQFRLRAIERYTQHRIIILPQSIHFSSRDALRRCGRAMRRHDDLYICVRDVESLEDAGDLTSPDRVLLCPDMALALRRLTRPVTPSIPVYALRRTDKESADLGNAPPAIESGDWVGAPATRFAQRVASFDRWQMRYPHRLKSMDPVRVWLYDRLAREHLERGLRQLAIAEVVITDRLHAHLLCSLMGVPHVVLDNSYGKISRFRNQWHTGEAICRAAGSWDEAAAIASGLASTESAAAN